LVRKPFDDTGIVGADVCVAGFRVGSDDADVGEETTEAVAFAFWEAVGGGEDSWVSGFTKEVEAEVDERARLVPVARSEGCQNM
jgi:hypothetical protein